jgi:hypothetical protein
METKIGGGEMVDENNVTERERCIEDLLLDGTTHLWVEEPFFSLIKSVLEQLPLEVLKQLREKEFRFLAPNRRFLGRVTRLDHNYRSGELLVFLSPELLLHPLKKIHAVIAHELAHVFLGHEETPSADARRQGEDDERHADDLVQRWGFDLTLLTRE